MKYSPGWIQRLLAYLYPFFLSRPQCKRSPKSILPCPQARKIFFQWKFFMRSFTNGLEASLGSMSEPVGGNFRSARWKISLSPYFPSSSKHQHLLLNAPVEGWPKILFAEFDGKSIRQTVNYLGVTVGLFSGSFCTKKFGLSQAAKLSSIFLRKSQQCYTSLWYWGTELEKEREEMKFQAPSGIRTHDLLVTRH